MTPEQKMRQKMAEILQAQMAARASRRGPGMSGDTAMAADNNFRRARVDDYYNQRLYGDPSALGPARYDSMPNDGFDTADDADYWDTSFREAVALAGPDIRLARKAHMEANPEHKHAWNPDGSIGYGELSPGVMPINGLGSPGEVEQGKAWARTSDALSEAAKRRRRAREAKAPKAKAKGK